jgi:hypothetical protein
MLTPEAIELLNSRSTAEESPFEWTPGRVTLRADQFEFRPRYERGLFAGYTIRYFWRGLCVSVEQLECDDVRAPITLQGVELRYSIEFKGGNGHA